MTPSDIRGARPPIEPNDRVEVTGKHIHTGKTGTVVVSQGRFFNGVTVRLDEDGIQNIVGIAARNLRKIEAE